MSAVGSTAPRRGRLRRMVTTALLNIVLPLVLGVAGVEVLGQWYFDNPFNFWKYRFGYISTDPYRNVGDIWTFRPNLAVRAVAIYKRPFGGFFVQSDCRHESDGLGYL